MKTFADRRIYLAGISFQLFNMLVFCYLVAEYLWRARKDGLQFASFGKVPMQLTLWGIFLSSVLIITRVSVVVEPYRLWLIFYGQNFFRCVELGQGFDGYLARHEMYFLILDALLMVLCLITLA